MNRSSDSENLGIEKLGESSLASKVASLIARGLHDLALSEEKEKALLCAEVGDIFKAAALGDIKGVRAILDIDPAKANERQHQTGATPLHIAVQEEEIEVVRLLLKYGSDPDVRDQTWRGWSPFYLAVRQDSKAIARELLASGADVNVEDNHGNTPLKDAVAERIYSLPLLPVGLVTSIRRRIHRTEQIEFVKLLLSAGADVNFGGTWGGGFTPLHLAACGGNSEVIELLLDNGANVDAVAEDEAMGAGSLTALGWLAFSTDHAHAAEVLITRGASVNVRNEKGWTPLLCARRRRHLNVAKVLMLHGSTE